MWRYLRNWWLSSFSMRQLGAMRSEGGYSSLQTPTKNLLARLGLSPSFSDAERQIVHLNQAVSELRKDLDNITNMLRDAMYNHDNCKSTMTWKDESITEEDPMMCSGKPEPPLDRECMILEIRNRISDMFSTNYIQPLTINSIDDLSHCITVSSLTSYGFASMIAKYVMRQKVPECLLHHACDFMVRNGYTKHTDLLDERGQMDEEELKRVLSWLEVKKQKQQQQDEEDINIWVKLWEAIVGLSEYFRAPSKTPYRRLNGELGLMCVVADAVGYVAEDGSPLLCSELKFDAVLGPAILDEENDSGCYIPMATIACRAEEIPDAIQLLGMIFRVVKWVEKCLCPDMDHLSLYCHGFLFIPREIDTMEDESRKALEKSALADHGFHLMLESM